MNDKEFEASFIKLLVEAAGPLSEDLRMTSEGKFQLSKTRRKEIEKLLAKISRIERTGSMGGGQ